MASVDVEQQGHLEFRHLLDPSRELVEDAGAIEVSVAHGPKRGLFPSQWVVSIGKRVIGLAACFSQQRVGAAILDSDARTTFWNRSGLGRAPAAYFLSTRARAIEPVAAAFLDAPSNRG